MKNENSSGFYMTIENVFSITGKGLFLDSYLRYY